MASIVIFSTLWGVGLNEWKGAGKTAIRLLVVGLFILITSTVIIGYGNYLALPSYCGRNRGEKFKRSLLRRAFNRCGRRTPLSLKISVPLGSPELDPRASYSPLSPVSRLHARVVPLVLIL
jgi:hypothetical protein